MVDFPNLLTLVCCPDVAKFLTIGTVELTGSDLGKISLCFSIDVVIYVANSSDSLSNSFNLDLKIKN